MDLQNKSNSSSKSKLIFIAIGSTLAVVTAGIGWQTLTGNANPLSLIESKISLDKNKNEGLFMAINLGSGSQKYGFIDKNGKEVIPVQFDINGSSLDLGNIWADINFGEISTSGVYGFSEGLAMVEIGGKIGYIDRTAKIIINPQFENGRQFIDGLAPVKIGKKWGYIQKDGKFIINPQFDKAGYFKEGLAPVALGDSPDKLKYGFIDKDGKFVVSPQYKNAFHFSEGLAAVEIGDEKPKWGFIDKTGKIAINPQFSTVLPFSEGLAAIEQTTDNSDSGLLRVGFINKTGQIVISPQFSTPIDISPLLDHVRTYLFSEGLAAVNIEGKYGYIDKTGKLIINPQFDSANRFSEDLAAVSINHQFGYIDKTGKIVINPQFDFSIAFSDGLAFVVTKDKSIGYIDNTGKYIWQKVLSKSEIKQPEVAQQAKTYVGSMNRAQQAFFLEQTQFTSDFDKLGLGIKSNTENHAYSIVAIDEKHVVQNVGLAKTEGLKSYTGIVFVKKQDATNELTTVGKLCESIQPTREMPPPPQLSGDDVQCPAGYVDFNR
ncbi:WG repeat-containing protein [uncultured Nostoc sp.]|uniref:WG repeat-containing protein n=1 Tax=uncultured Nostoc sp. TaxID=340711 RepID=UPI0035C9A1C7